MSFFETVHMMPDDPSQSLPLAFAVDPRKKKVDLTSDDYLDANGALPTFSCAKKAERQITDEGINHDALPVEGDPDLIRETLALIFGTSSPLTEANEVFAMQTLGGTHALCLGAEFIFEQFAAPLYISTPTWNFHRSIFGDAGLAVHNYSYYDPIRHRLDFDAFCESIKKMEPGSVIVLQPSCHSPTGIDPTVDQWKELSALIQKQKLLPFFDVAYQGLGKGLEEDVFPIRYFAKEQHEMIVAYTFSKNMEIFSERVGLLAVVTHNSETTQKVKSQFKQILKHHYTHPPAFGAQLISTILQSKELFQDWERELFHMRERIVQMRKSLISSFLSKDSGLDFSYLNGQCGLFSFCGLDRDQIHRLRQENGVYIPLSGSINIASLNWQNIDYVTEAVLSVLSI